MSDESRAGEPERGGRTGDREVSLEEQAEMAGTFVAGLVREFGLQAQVTAEPGDEDSVEVATTGDDLGLLIGPRGQTLAAIQELARTVVQRSAAIRPARLVVDVSGYRQKRREALERFTRQVADEVLASGSRRALEPMNAADRKIVHDTVNALPGLATVSEGEEPRRRVVIAPESAATATEEPEGS